MTLDQILQTVEGSSPTDWHSMETQTIHSWVVSQGDDGSSIEPKTHSKLLVFRPDIDISVVMDATIVEPFVEPWTQMFQDKHASSVSVQLRYHGAIVFQWVFVVVDGGRYLLPLPEVVGGAYQLPKARHPLASLFFSLYGVGGVHSTVDRALAVAAIAIV